MTGHLKFTIKTVAFASFEFESWKDGRTIRVTQRVVTVVHRIILRVRQLL